MELAEGVEESRDHVAKVVDDVVRHVGTLLPRASRFFGYFLFLINQLLS